MKEDKFKRLKEKQKEISDLKKQMIIESNLIFTELTKEFFDENSELESFGWNQYTPYFILWMVMPVNSLQILIISTLMVSV